MNRWKHATTEALIEGLRESPRYIGRAPPGEFVNIMVVAADRIEKYFSIYVAAQELTLWLREVHEGRAMNADGIRAVRKFLEVWDRR